MSKKAIAIILIFSLVFFCGCGEKREKEEAVVDAVEDKIQIGMTFDSFVIERWQRDRDVFVSKARELDADVNVQAANGETDEQISQIEYFINKKVDVIVIVAVDTDALSGVIEKAKKAGISVMCYDRLVRNANVDMYISFDNVEVGKLMGQALYKKIGIGKNIVEICGPESDYNVELVAEGFEHQTKKSAGHVLLKCNCDNWKAESAYEYINKNAELIRKADGIMCGNDSLAGEVIRALAELRLAGDVCVVGQDADLEGCQRIVEGTQEMTVYKPVETLAKTAAEYAVKLAKGEELVNTETFFDGTYDIPYVKLDPIAVNIDNMNETVISGGFHLKEDVYINVTE